ncbi:hypothetical protein RSAG8_09325, partial [Rhizoctonia solani AG-8 WAC10335]
MRRVMFSARKMRTSWVVNAPLGFRESATSQVTGRLIKDSKITS